jgi:hypothetical protein
MARWIIEDILLSQLQEGTLLRQRQRLWWAFIIHLVEAAALEYYAGVAVEVETGTPEVWEAHISPFLRAASLTLALQGNLTLARLEAQIAPYGRQKRRRWRRNGRNSNEHCRGFCRRAMQRSGLRRRYLPVIKGIEKRYRN